MIKPPKEAPFRESTEMSLSLSVNNETKEIEVASIAFSDSDGCILKASESGEWSCDGVTPPYQRRMGVRWMNFFPMFSVVKQNKPTSKSSKIAKPKLTGAELLQCVDVCRNAYTNLGEYDP